MQRIGRFEIESELGRGAMGIVYSAVDPTLGRRLAIKTIRLTELTDPNERGRLRERLFREARSAGLLSHPNIVTVYDVGEEDGAAYIAMEYVDGQPLDRQLLSEPPDAGLVMAILRQIAAGLDYAHSRGVVHRDIKPANVMLHEGRTVKITDFGVARIQSQQMTQAGLLVGTPNYMAPEQVQGSDVDGRADQFSLAVIAYELLTGDRPFTGDSLATVVFRIVNEQPVPPQRINPSLGWPVEAVLSRGLSKDQNARYPTCTEFILALENACRTSGDWQPVSHVVSGNMPTLVAVPAAEPAAAAVAPAPEPEPARRPPLLLRIARALAVLVVAAGLALAAILFGLEWMSGGDEDQRAASDLRTETPPGDRRQQGRPAPPPASQLEPERPRAPAVRDEAERPATEERQVRFISSPPGATITIENGASCTTPCTLTVPPGRQSAAAALDGYRRALSVISNSTGDEVFISLERSGGTLAVRSDPPGATILVDGRERAEKTPALLSLPAGPHRLEVVKEGFAKYTEVVTVKDSVITNVNVNWPDR